MQLSQEEPIQFHFPTQDELQLFNRPLTKDEIINLMTRLKYSNPHYKHKIHFVYAPINTYSTPYRKSKKQPSFRFYFNCCQPRPKIIFRQTSPNMYSLEHTSSSFIHEHSPPQSQSLMLREYKKHWKTVKRQKKLLIRPICTQEEYEDNVEDDLNYNLNPKTFKNLKYLGFAERMTKSQSLAAIDDQNNFQNRQNQITSSNQIGQLSLEFTQLNKTQIQSPPRHQGHIVFTHQQKNPQSNKDVFSQISSFKKKIFKSRLYFDSKSKRISLLNRPWIFKPSKESNWIHKSLLFNQKQYSYKDISGKTAEYPIQIQQNNTCPFSSKQSISNHPNQSNQNNKEKQKSFIQKQKKNQRQNAQHFPKQKFPEFVILEGKETISKFKKKTIDHSHPIQQNISPENKSIGIQNPTLNMSKAAYHTFEWYKKFTSRLFETRLIGPLNKKKLEKIREQLKNEKPFKINSTQEKEVRQIFASFWQESNFLLLKVNNFLDCEFQKYDLLGLKNKQNTSRFCNKLFISKKVQHFGKDGQNSKKLFSDTIFLGIYPLNLLGLNRPLEILVAYQISTKLEAKLAWFGTFQQKITSQSQQKEKIIIKNIMECLLKSIELMKLSNVHFVYTTLSKRLIWGLCNAMKKMKNINGSGMLSFSMHSSCIRKLLELEKNEAQMFVDFLCYIRPCITNCQEKENIEKSKAYFLNLIQTKKSSNETLLINPRELYDYFKFIRIDFHQILHSKPYRLDMSFLNSQFYHEAENNKIKDPVREINEALASATIFQGFEEFFPLLLAIFNTNFHKGLRIVDEHLIVPNNFMWKENQLLISNQIFNTLQKNDLSESIFRKLFKSSVLDLEKVVKNCPRLLIHTMYRLIYFSSLKSISNEQDYIMNESLKSKLNAYTVSNPIKRICVNVFETEKLQNQNQEKDSRSDELIIQFLKHSIVEELSDQKSEKKSDGKEWICDCNFYNVTGIPCQHEICCAITFKTSIYNEVNKKWKSQG